jgi:hypothetical protein
LVDDEATSRGTRRGRLILDFAQRVSLHRTKLKRRGYPLAAEALPPVGQAALWYEDAIRCLPRSGRHVAKQLALFCGDDSRATVPWRSLADAVCKADRAGRSMAYTQQGVKELVGGGWLEKETVGGGRSARTTFSLLPGERIGRSERQLDHLGDAA